MAWNMPGSEGKLSVVLQDQWSQWHRKDNTAVQGIFSIFPPNTKFKEFFHLCEPDF